MSDDLKPHKPFPRKCECGGRIKYERDFGRVFSYCKRCTPLSVMRVEVFPKPKTQRPRSTEGRVT